MPNKSSKVKVKKSKIPASQRGEQTKTQKLAKKIAAKKLGALELEVFDAKGKVKEIVKLPKEIFGVKINKALLSQAVRVYLANQRKGTASTKTRGEVVGSTRKIWQQKGTGRARHGSRKAPIFVGGGIVFGPRPRDYSLDLPKNMKRLALFSALSSKLKEGEIKGVTSLDSLEPKTKIIAEIFKNLNIAEKKRNVLFVMPFGPKFENLHRAVRNLRGVNILNANILNTYEVLNNRLILLLKEAIPVMEKTFLAHSASSGQDKQNEK